MILRATPVLLLLAALTAGTPALHAQSTALEKGCTRSTVKPPLPENKKQGALNAARVRVVEGAREGVARRAAEAGITEPKGIFVLQADKDRSSVTLAEARTNLPNGLLEGVAAEAADLFAGWPEKGVASVAVRLDSLPVPEVEVGGQRTNCMPKVLNPEEVMRELERYLAANRSVMSKRVSETKVRMLITREGEIMVPELSRYSGKYSWDQFVLETVRGLHVAPARIDGVPYDAWTMIPFTMQGPTR
jgi:hypothetical protein